MQRRGLWPFFSSVRPTAEYLTDVFFDCASYWRINPFELLNMPISEIPAGQSGKQDRAGETHTWLNLSLRR